VRILFVAHPSSIHTARWISQLPLDDWDIHLFPVHDGLVHAALHDITVHSFYRTWPFENNPNVRRKGLYWPVLKGRGKIKKCLEHIIPGKGSNAARLAGLIQSLKPDVIHVLEMQPAGYLLLEAARRINGGPRPPCVYSSWGNDLFYHGRERLHEERIRSFLAECDYYIADCQRDEKLVRDFGFRGKMLGVFSAAGGFDLKRMSTFRQPGPSSSRRVIALKGYQDVSGADSRAALNALTECRDLLHGYELVVYSVSDAIRGQLNEMARIDGLKVTELPNSPHDEMLRLFGRSRVAIGISATDGTPNAMLEAMVMGAFPVQTDTVSTPEWIDDGRNGLLVSIETASIRRALERAIADDELVDQAAEINAELTRRLAKEIVQPQILEIYRQVAGQDCVRERPSSGQFEKVARASGP